jgi:hypothetical protein
MAKIDKEELKKLTPDERIKKLKELEAESRKEIEEAGKIIKETEATLTREKIAESVKIPETKPIDLDSLFEEQKSLETTVKQEAPKEEEKEVGLYQLAQDYDEAKDILYTQDSLDKGQLEWIDRLGEKVDKMKYTSNVKEMANLVVATRSVIYKIRKFHQQDGTFL